MLKAILFDMDGVLFDSMPNHAYAWSHAMTDFGLKMEPEEVYMNEGRTGKGTITRGGATDIRRQEFTLQHPARSATDAGGYGPIK